MLAFVQLCFTADEPRAEPQSPWVLLVREQQRNTFKVTPELEAWLLQAADKPATPLTGADFEAIRAMHGRRDLPLRLLEPPGTD